jgi:hypothetical protein
MPALHKDLMNRLYGHDVWADFTPNSTSDTVEGWNGNHPSLNRLVETVGPRTVVDVGVWKGQSTITLARAMKRAAIDGCVIAVDTFLGSLEHWNREQELFRRHNAMPDIFSAFMSNVYTADVQDYVIPLPQTSVSAAQILTRMGITAALVHIDAAHEYQEVLRDAEEYWNIVEAGGYLMGDDYHRTWPGVVRAAGEFSASRCLPLTIEPPKWILQKPAHPI